MARGKLRRRRFVQIGATAAVAGHTISCNRTQTPWRFLTPEEARTLAAVCDQIIPPDTDPGGAQAGVVDYIDIQLTRFYRGLQNVYRTGLAGVNESSRTMFRAPFVEIDREQQLAVLHAMEKEQAPGDAWKQTSSKVFFDLMITHTMQGYYGNPRHGGNRDAVSWKMLGVPEPPVRGRQHYELPPKG